MPYSSFAVRPLPIGLGLPVLYGHRRPTTNSTITCSTGGQSSDAVARRSLRSAAQVLEHSEQRELSASRAGVRPTAADDKAVVAVCLPQESQQGNPHGLPVGQYLDSAHCGMLDDWTRRIPSAILTMAQTHAYDDVVYPRQAFTCVLVHATAPCAEERCSVACLSDLPTFRAGQVGRRASLRETLWLAFEFVSRDQEGSQSSALSSCSMSKLAWMRPIRLVDDTPARNLAHRGEVTAGWLPCYDPVPALHAKRRPHPKFRTVGPAS